MTMSDNPMPTDALRRAGPTETVEPGVAHVEIEPGAPTETAGRGPLQVDDETGQRVPVLCDAGAPTDRPATGDAE